jgi:nucleotide-binding universal stress UspA family protein
LVTDKERRKTMAIKSIVCGVTGSENSEKAVKAASEMAAAEQAHLTFVYVVDVGFLSGLTVQLRPQYAEDFLERLGGKILDEAVAVASSKGVAAKKTLRKGKVMDEVVKTVKEESADILVAGDEGHGFAERVLFGHRPPDSVKEMERRAGVTVKLVR